MQASCVYFTTVCATVTLSFFGGSRSVRPDAHQLLAEIGALQQSHERSGRAVQTLRDEFAMPDLALAHPSRHVLEKIRMPRGEIADDKASDIQPFCQYRPHHRRGPFRRSCLAVVVMRDQAAHRHARERIEQREYRFEHLTSDILEIDVDAFRAGFLQLRREIGLAMIEAIIEAELFFHIIAFVLAAREPDGTRALDPGDLADRRADRAGRHRNADDFAGLRLADVEPPGTCP